MTHPPEAQTLYDALCAAEAWYSGLGTPNDYRAMVPVVGAFTAVSQSQRLGKRLYGPVERRGNAQETSAETFGNGKTTDLERATNAQQTGAGTVETVKTTDSERSGNAQETLGETRRAFVEALDNAIADVPLLRPLAAPLLGPMWTSELKNLLMVIRSLVACRGPDLPEHLHIPFLDGMARLHGMYEQLMTLDPLPSRDGGGGVGECLEHSTPKPARGGRIEAKLKNAPEYSAAMTKKEARRRFGNPSPATFQELLRRYGFDQLNRQAIRLRLDTMDHATRTRFLSRI